MFLIRSVPGENRAVIHAVRCGVPGKYRQPVGRRLAIGVGENEAVVVGSGDGAREGVLLSGKALGFGLAFLNSDASEPGTSALSPQSRTCLDELSCSVRRTIIRDDDLKRTVRLLFQRIEEGW